jgi:hypothetical protein
MDEDALEADHVLIGPTFREQIVKARRGQGVFRANVLLRETCCRVTLVDDPRHLKASHIKPWRDATDNERLDGSNGFLLSPHIDHLFDQGYLTFSPDQRLLVVPEVRDRLIDAWGIHTDVDVGRSPESRAPTSTTIARTSSIDTGRSPRAPERPPSGHRRPRVWDALPGLSIKFLSSSNSASSATFCADHRHVALRTGLSRKLQRE